MTKKHKLGNKSLKDARVSLLALLILIVMIIFMVSPAGANAVSKDEIAIEFTKPVLKAKTAEYEVILQMNSCAIPVADERALTIDRDAELYTLEEVLYQVTALDKDAVYRVVKKDNQYILEVMWSRRSDVIDFLELLKVDEELFICRGEDFRSMMVSAIFSKKV